MILSVFLMFLCLSTLKTRKVQRCCLIHWKALLNCSVSNVNQNIPFYLRSVKKRSYRIALFNNLTSALTIIILNSLSNWVNGSSVVRFQFLENPLTTAQAHILARTLLATTRQAIELESYPNHPRIQLVFGLKSKKKRFSFSVWVSLAGPLQVGVFWLFLANFTWPWIPTHWAIILVQDFFGN